MTGRSNYNLIPRKFCTNKVTAETTKRLLMKNLPTLCHYSSFVAQFSNSVSMKRVILRFTIQIVEMFEQHASMPRMWSAWYQTTILRCGSTPVSTVLRKSVRFLIIDILSCKASSEEKKLAKLSCMNDSETQERGLWEVKIEKNFPLGHAPGPSRSLRLRRSFRKSVSINPRSVPDPAKISHG